MLHTKEPRRLHRLRLIPVCLMCLLASPAIAQMGRERVSLIDAGLHRVRTEVAIGIDGATRVARFEVQEEFRNASHRVMEADFLYPVPRGAVFENLSLFVGEVELRGEMLRGDEARGIYEEIVRRRRDPALVQLAGQDLIRARVFPIEPGQTRKIILRYTQVLPTDTGITRLRYPGAVSALVPRDGTAVVRERLAAPQPDDVPVLLSIVLDRASRFGTPVSPTHAVDVIRRGGDRAEIMARSDPEHGDFVLLLPHAGSEVAAGLVAHSPDPDREAGYFLLLVTPPPAAESDRIARDLTLLLDVSGSMSGRKIEQARVALAGMLRGLQPTDRFRLITFSSVVRSFRGELIDASAANVDEAVRYLRAVPADGSTNVAEALEVALESPTTRGRTAQVVLLTDGRPTAGETDPLRISQMAAAHRYGERLFAFGVGEDVNTYLLDHLAGSGRGSVAYVQPQEDVEAAVATLNRRIASPALTDLRIASAPVGLEELFPDPLPDLFHGEELRLLGRYQGSGAGELVLEGQRGNATVRLCYPLEFPRWRPDDNFVANLWAARKAGALTARIRLEGPDPELVNAVRDLGLRYGVLTEYTAYLVTEPATVAGRLDSDTALLRARQEARAPGEQTGAKAFRDSRRSSLLRAAGSMAEAEAMIVDALAAPSAGAHVVRTRRAGGRRFVLRDLVWSDIAHDPQAPTVRIAPFGSVWLRLSQESEALRSALALGERVIIAGEGLTLIVEPGGVGQLERRVWRQLQLAFRELDR